MTEFHIIIPARHASSRLPGKPLLEIAGRSLLENVHRRAVDSGAATVTVATDDARIEAAVRAFGGRAVMTDPEHPSGTDRLAECAVALGLEPDAIVVNLQGDEPLTPPGVPGRLATGLADHPEAEMATVCVPVESERELHSAHAVKVVRNADGMALYFSRAPIPWHRERFSDGRAVLPDDAPYLRHIGLYAYRVDLLARYATLAPSPLERAESLEQLRALHHGIGIYVDVLEERFPPGVDTAEDLERVRALLEAPAALSQS